jgi:seryl-tRNA synthetase
MTARNTAKAKQTETAKAPAKTGTASGLGAENARLKAELAQAKERITDLELKQNEIINRIDWVIDSLHNLPD